MRRVPECHVVATAGRNAAIVAAASCPASRVCACVSASCGHIGARACSTRLCFAGVAWGVPALAARVPWQRCRWSRGAAPLPHPYLQCAVLCECAWCVCPTAMSLAIRRVVRVHERVGGRVYSRVVSSCQAAAPACSTSALLHPACHLPFRCPLTLGWLELSCLCLCECSGAVDDRGVLPCAHCCAFWRCFAQASIASAAPF